VQVAAEHSEAVSQRAGISVKERLLLDGIALDATDIAPGYIQRAALVVADFANAGLALWNRAAMSAGEAAHAIAVELFVQLALADIFVNYVTESGQRDLGKNCYL
jgi:hypothetical protein